MSALHQMRISQVPLGHGTVTTHHHHLPQFWEEAGEEEEPGEKLSSLDHVRYHIVGQHWGQPELFTSIN